MSFSDKVSDWRWYGAVGVLAAIGAMTVGILTPEVRCKIGLECRQAAATSTTTSTTGPPVTDASKRTPAGATSSTSPSSAVSSSSAVTTTTRAAPRELPSSSTAMLTASSSEASLKPTPSVTIDDGAGGFCRSSVVLEDGSSWDPPDPAYWDSWQSLLGSPVRVRAYHGGNEQRLDIDGAPYLPTTSVDILTLQEDCRLRQLGRLEPGEDLAIVVPAGSGLFYRLTEADYQPGRGKQPAGTISDGWQVNGDADTPAEQHEFEI